MNLRRDIKLKDQRFFKELHSFCRALEDPLLPEPIVPLKWTSDGDIDRKATLKMSVYADFPKQAGSQ